MELENEEKVEEVVTESEAPADVPAQPQEKKMKTYKEITCKKCGFIHSSNDRECPNCGFSITREILKIAIFAILVISIIASEVFLIVRVNKLETQVTEMSSTLQDVTDFLDEVTGTSDTDQLKQLQYYENSMLTDTTKLADLGDDYLIYALQDDCSACATANEYVYNFVISAYPEYIPIYFVTPDSSETLFFDTLNCESTPTLYRMSGEKIVKSVVGVDEVYDMLLDITNEANGQ